MLEIVEREGIERCGCAQAEAFLTVGWMLWVLVSMRWPGGTNLGIVTPVCRLVDGGCRALSESFGNCVLKMLAEGVQPPVLKHGPRSL